MTIVIDLEPRANGMHAARITVAKEAKTNVVAQDLIGFQEHGVMNPDDLAAKVYHVVNSHWTR